MKERYAHIPILSIDEMRELPEPQEFDAGVYFLWFKEGLTYIGKSKHICERIYIQACMNKNGHNYLGTRMTQIPFDKITCLVLQNGPTCPAGLDGLLTSHERAYIAAYLPAFNQDFQHGYT